MSENPKYTPKPKRDDKFTPDKDGAKLGVNNETRDLRKTGFKDGNTAHAGDKPQPPKVELKRPEVEEKIPIGELAPPDEFGDERGGAVAEEVLSQVPPIKNNGPETYPDKIVRDIEPRGRIMTDEFFIIDPSLQIDGGDGDDQIETDLDETKESASIKKEIPKGEPTKR